MKPRRKPPRVFSIWNRSPLDGRRRVYTRACLRLRSSSNAAVVYNNVSYVRIRDERRTNATAMAIIVVPLKTRISLFSSFPSAFYHVPRERFERRETSRKLLSPFRICYLERRSPDNNLPLLSRGGRSGARWILAGNFEKEKPSERQRESSFQHSGLLGESCDFLRKRRDPHATTRMYVDTEPSASIPVATNERARATRYCTEQINAFEGTYTCAYVRACMGVWARGNMQASAYGCCKIIVGTF